MRQFLARFYEIRDVADKFHTLVIELKSPDYPRSLKLEMRKGVKMTKTERAIAYSRHSSVQVYVRTIRASGDDDVKDRRLPAEEGDQGRL